MPVSVVTGARKNNHRGFRAKKNYKITGGNAEFHELRPLRVQMRDMRTLQTHVSLSSWQKGGVKITSFFGTLHQMEPNAFHKPIQKHPFQLVSIKLLTAHITP